MFRCFAKNTMKLVLVLSSVLLLCCCCDGSSSYTVPDVAFADLVGLGKASVDFGKILGVDGIVQVTGIPGFHELRRKVLRDAARCAAVKRDELEISRAVFSDETIRATFAVTTQNGHSHRFNFEGQFGKEHVPDACYEFERSSSKLRQSVTKVSNALFSVMDDLCQGGRGKRHGEFARSIDNNGRPYENAWQFLHAGQHLEHFHSYELPCEGETDAQDTIEMHIDEGLFIGLVPALWASMDLDEIGDWSKVKLLEDKKLGNASGFFIETPHGDVVQPVFKDDGDVLVFMMGAGTGDWFTHCPPIRAVPHRVSFSENQCEHRSSHSKLVRLWYGRMFMAPYDAVYEPFDMSFGAIRNETIQRVTANRDLAEESNGAKNNFPAMMGCSNGIRDLAGSCPDGQFYCWMACRAWAPSSNCSESLPITDFHCKDPATGQEWHDGDDHCPTCVVTCSPTPKSNTDGICNGLGTTMYMLGFQGADAAEACLVLWFQPWVLDEPWKLAVGIIGVFMFAIGTESVIRLRKRFAQEHGRFNKIFATTLYMILYITQVTFGYFLMLAVMTYSSYVFVAAILGLALGHFIFNMNLESQAASEFSDPCCQFMEDVNLNGAECGGGAQRDQNLEAARASSATQDSSSFGNSKKRASHTSGQDHLQLEGKACCSGEQ